MVPDFVAGTPYGTAFILFVAVSAFCWVMSLLTGEFSWVDRLWSVVPPAYCLIVAADLDFRSARVNIMTVLVLMWGVRLTANFAVKGGYQPGGEDYRWAYMRGKLSKLQFQLLNVTFICPGQMIIIWLFTSPVHQAWLFSDQPIGWLDYVAIVVFLLLLAGESVADAQMLRFQKNKSRLRDAGLEVRTVHGRGPVPVLPPPQLLLRDGDVGDLLPLRHLRIEPGGALDGPRLPAADRALSRLHESHRGDLQREVPGLQRLPGRRPRVVPIPLRKLVGR